MQKYTALKEFFLQTVNFQLYYLILFRLSFMLVKKQKEVDLFYGIWRQ